MDCSSGYGLVYAIYRNSTVKEMVKGHITARFGSILASIMASETVPKEVAPYISVLRVIDLPLSTFSVMYFVYGIYVLIFGTYLYMMRNHEQKYDNTSVANRLYLRLAVVLFVLSTIFVADFTAMRVQDSELFFNAAKARDYRTLYRYLTSANKERMALFSLETLIPIFSNMAADWMLIHRCYTIWSFDKRIGIPLITASVISNAAGIASIIVILVSLNVRGLWHLSHQGRTSFAAYNICSAGINSILTLLTAGRIWWIHRQVRARGIQSTDNFIPSVCRIILESGIIYPLLQIADLVEVNTTDMAPFDFFPLVTLSAGLAPTLILVRAKLGKTVESLQREEAVSDIRFNDRRGAVDTTATGTQAQSLNVALTGASVGSREEEGKVESV